MLLRSHCPCAFIVFSPSLNLHLLTSPMAAPTRRRCRCAAASHLVVAFFLGVSSVAAADLSTVNLPGERLPLEKVDPLRIPRPLPLAGALAPNKLLLAAQPIFPEIIGCSEF